MSFFAEPVLNFHTIFLIRHAKAFTFIAKIMIKNTHSSESRCTFWPKVKFITHINLLNESAASRQLKRVKKNKRRGEERTREEEQEEE